MKIVALLAVLLCFACSRPPPPNEIAIDPRLPAGVQEAAADAAAAWCAVSDRTGWCPEVKIASVGTAFVTFGHWDRELTEGEAMGAAACNQSGSTIVLSSFILKTWPEAQDADFWRGHLMHEFGHFGIWAPAHDDGSPVMKEVHEWFGDYPEDVDAKAIKMWNEQN